MKHQLTLETKIPTGFEVDQVAGLFDLPPAATSRVELAVEVPGIPPDDDGWGDWRVGAIVGPSGSGKTSVARHVYGKAFTESHATGKRWPKDKAVVQCFGKGVQMADITATLSAVGFSSPPAWIRPYHVLSNGEQFRCDLARSLLAPADVVAFDEFTSVVDRQVGQFASAAVAKAVRKRRVGVERFVAVTCHYDVLVWLQPDWVLDMATCQLARGHLQRPDIRLTLHRLPNESDKDRQPGAITGREMWRRFHRHHYLSADLHQLARCYVACWDDEPIAFCATLTNVGKRRGRRRVTRLVTLPDFQGMGVGIRVLEAVVAHEAAAGYDMSIVTTHPGLVAALNHRERWTCRSVYRRGNVHDGFRAREGRTLCVPNRATISFAYRPAS